MSTFWVFELLWLKQMGFNNKRLEYCFHELFEINFHRNCHLHNREENTLLADAEILLIKIQSDLFIERECRSTVLDITTTGQIYFPLYRIGMIDNEWGDTVVILWFRTLSVTSLATL